MGELSKAYEPVLVEKKWYGSWLDKKHFVADEKSGKPAYAIVIPPPNVTGMLHMGHVLNNTIQDMLARRSRMDGCEVLWLPGTDHAGIATQVMVEKQLKKEEKKSRHDLGREEFLKRVWVWKEKHGDIIINQLKKLGCSCDWSRERFTMDAEYSRCVQKVFVELYKKGLIYRGKRMVNWCPVSQTALSDEEVEMKPQKGFMYHFKVQVDETPETWLTIATTRPETIPGDTAVAVNPKDPRYAHLIGKHIVRPLPAELPHSQKLIPIVGDEHVDFEFGTGVLKVTPAHDKADFDIGARHKLPLIEVINADGTMNALAGELLAGLDRFKARKVAVELLTEQGVMIEAKPYENNVGFSQRADVPIEPRLSEQWFLKYPAVEESRACVNQQMTFGGKPLEAHLLKEKLDTQPAPNAAIGISDLVGNVNYSTGKMQFHPDRWAKVYDHWLSNIQDWCISRQLWWGHRIPVWSGLLSGASIFSLLGGVLKMAALNGVTPEEFEKTVLTIDGNIISCDLNSLDFACAQLGQCEADHRIIVCSSSEMLGQHLVGIGLDQDPDVLDTWFSSWLWPFATMGWTGDKQVDGQNAMLKKFYPTSDLVTGPDIIFFWVARMIMAGYEFMGEMPFKNVYFTGIIRDKQGRKMSKTLGNSPDPLELIAKYGADALRFGTMRTAPLGQDVLFDEKDVEQGRNFCNKLWNACRFRQLQGACHSSPDPLRHGAHLSPFAKDILWKLDATVSKVRSAYESYHFNEVTQALYDFVWGDFCDWFIESVKSDFQDGCLLQRKEATLETIDFVLHVALRLLHPLTPFITEELWEQLGFSGGTIQFAEWPKTDAKFQAQEFVSAHGQVTACFSAVSKARNLRAEYGIASNKRVRWIFLPTDPSFWADAECDALKTLLNASTLDIQKERDLPKGTPVCLTEIGELALPLEGLVDFAAEQERLNREIAKVVDDLAKTDAKLSNPDFAAKVPPAVLEEHRQRFKNLSMRKAQLEQRLKDLA